MNAVKKVAMVAMLATALGAFADIETFPYEVTYGMNYQKTAPVTLTGNTVSLDKVRDMPAADTVAQVLVNSATVTAIPADEWDDAVADYVTGTPQAAIGMMLKGDGITLVWKALTGAGTWTELTGTASEGTWFVRMEFDYTVNPVKVRYSVSADGTAWTVLTAAGGGAWLSNAASATTITGVDLAGVGTVASANATSGARKAYAHIDSVADETSFDYTSLKLKIDVGSVVYGSDLGLRVDINNGSTTNTVTPNAENVIDLSNLVLKGNDYAYSVYAVSQTSGTQIPDSVVLKSGTIVYQTKEPTITEDKIMLNSNTQLALSSSVSAGDYTVEGNYKLAWTDAADRYATFADGKLTVIEGTPANGIPSYASYILGLDATDATKKPLIQTVPDALPGKFTFAVGNVGTVKTDLADVKYELGAADTPTAATFTKVGEGTDTIAVDIPADAVKYYKLNIQVTTK